MWHTVVFSWARKAAWMSLRLSCAGVSELESRYPPRSGVCSGTAPSWCYQRRTRNSAPKGPGDFFRRYFWAVTNGVYVCFQGASNQVSPSWRFGVVVRGFEPLVLVEGAAEINALCTQAPRYTDTPGQGNIKGCIFTTTILP